MTGYKAPRTRRKKRQHEAAAKTAASQKKAPIEIPVAQVVIPGLTLIPQARDVSIAQPPTQPSAVSQQPPKPRSKSKQRESSTTPPAAPSASSGGVPEPTPQYIAQAFLNPQALTQPRRILIIMDLNGTLLHRPNKRRPFNFVERPNARAFLNYCLETFYVAIWSSARPENVSKMVAQLLTPAQRDRCLLIWARDRFGLSPTDYNSKVQVYKRLTAVWSNPRVMASHPSAIEGGRWDQTNTVLVDDSLEKARSEPFNLLQLPEFSGLATEQPHVLPQVHDYLNSLSHQRDISRFMRTSPFKLDTNYKLLSA